MNQPASSQQQPRQVVRRKGFTTTCHWLTFREAQRQGGHVRKGERATPVVYWKWRTPEEIAQRATQTGKEDMVPCMPRGHSGQSHILIEPQSAQKQFLAKNNSLSVVSPDHGT